MNFEKRPDGYSFWFKIGQNKILPKKSLIYQGLISEQYQAIEALENA